MNNLVLDDTISQHQLLPFTHIRSAADIRVGILTIREKWAAISQPGNSKEVVIPGNLLPSNDIVNAICNGTFDINNLPAASRRIHFPWHIFQLNDWALREDFVLLTKGRFSQAIPESVQVMNVRDIFIEEGATLGHCMLNASTGPIYIGKHSQVMEGSIIRGPFALCEGSVVKMGAKIYGATTVGPYSVVGGEIKNSVIMGYSNKAHDGYLGDAVIGEWCNLGAGTSNSNIKNSAGDVKVWNETASRLEVVGLKCGLLMGDYSRSAINTSFNTGTVTGICCNIFGEGLMPKYIPSFSWGGKETTRYKFDIAIRDIENWKKLKNKTLAEKEINQLKHIFDNH